MVLFYPVRTGRCTSTEPNVSNKPRSALGIVDYSELELHFLSMEAPPDMRYCPCGSGKIRQELRDARGIFVAFVCSVCEKDVMGKYRPEIFTNPHYECDEPFDE